MAFKTSLLCMYYYLTVMISVVEPKEKANLTFLYIYICNLEHVDSFSCA